MKTKVVITPRDYYGTYQRLLLYEEVYCFSFESKSYCRYVSSTGVTVSKETFMAEIKEYENSNSN